MTDKVLERTLEGVDYESNVRFIQYHDMEQNSSQLPYTAIYGEVLIGSDSLMHGELVVFQSGGDIFKLLDADSKREIDINKLDGVVVNDLIRHKYKLSLGDTVTFRKKDNIFSLPIAAFERSAFGETVYCGYEFAKNNGIIEHSGYNGLYTNNVVSFDPQKHIFVSTVEDMKNQFQEQKGTYSSLFALFFVLGILVGLITLQIALQLVTNANRKYIAMMKAYFMDYGYA